MFTILKLYKYFRNEKPDVIHTSGAEANFHGFFAAKMANVPKIIVEEIGIPQFSKKAEFIFKYIFRRADFVVGESQVVTKYMSEKFNLPKEKAKTIHNFGLFNYDFSKIHLHKINNCFRILMVSRLETVKNIEAVLNTVSRLIKMDVNIHLSIAGVGSIENMLKNKAKELKIDNHVSFLGLIEDPYIYLLNSDLYILNSFTEGFSNSLIEAMYSKTASLSTNVGAAPEIIQPDINGFLIPADNENELFTKIREIMSLPREKLKEIGVAGHKTIVQNYSLDGHAKKLMEIYKIDSN